MDFKKFFFYIKTYLNFENIKTSLLVFWYSLLKQNTKYPKYLLNFEKKVANFFGSKYAISFSNGTTACTTLLYSLGVKKNSKVIISKLTFPSVISSILRIGAIPQYIDFDKNLQLKNNFNENKILNADYILITHAYGIPQNSNTLETILKLNKKIILIEDISHSQGATNKNKMVIARSAASFMSMQGDKAINAGEGGVIITNSDEVYKKVIYLSHLNRKTLPENNLNSLSTIGFIGKGRMNPLGAITATSDIKNLNKRNKILRKKMQIIYDGFKKFDNIHIPQIDDFENTGGFHYGFPFFCDSETRLINLKKIFQILKYNWPFLDANENFHDPNKFLELIYNDNLMINNVFEKVNDIRDQLYFFSLKEIKNLNEQEIKKKISNFKKNEI